jgi:hypothetical protein
LQSCSHAGHEASEASEASKASNAFKAYMALTAFFRWLITFQDINRLLSKHKLFLHREFFVE